MFIEGNEPSWQKALCTHSVKLHRCPSHHEKRGRQGMAFAFVGTKQPHPSFGRTACHFAEGRRRSFQIRREEDVRRIPLCRTNPECCEITPLAHFLYGAAPASSTRYYETKFCHHMPDYYRFLFEGMSLQSGRASIIL